MSDSIPLGICQCGCGASTEIAGRTHRNRGHIKGQPLRYVKNHNRPGSRAGGDYVVTDGPLDTPCWLWQRILRADGYGYVGTKAGGTRLAHRITYEATVGPIPDGMQLDHLCRNRACVNPAHLEPVPPRVNVRRGVQTKLTPDQVIHIRSSSETHKSLAREFGVHPSTILRIRRHERWRVDVAA